MQIILAKTGTLPDGRPVADAVQTVAFPGLGTGVGRVGPNTCAVQMRAAIDAVLLGATPFPRTWTDAENGHLALFGARPRDMQRD